MHRELSHADEAFAPPANVSLYLMTAALGLLIGLDLWPALVNWLGPAAAGWPTWPREVGGYRYAFVAALAGTGRVLYGAFDALLDGRLSADLAVAIAALAALAIGEPLVAAEVVFIGMAGECLESVTFERTRRAVRGLVEVFPTGCWRLRDGQEERVFTRELAVGDTVVVKPGAKVPVDGVVVAGTSAVNASALTGESVPVDKSPGDAVLAGSVNLTGPLTIEARKVADQTVAGRVIELTAQALKDKSPMERTADRLARLFLPVVLALAAVTFLANVAYHAGPFRADRLPPAAAARLSLYPTLAVLVVACPCPLVLATPAAVVAALGRLAGTGVLLKGGSALERLAAVERVAFDKTGTLTEGRFELGDVVPFGPSADEVLRVAAAAEQGSDHPLARPVVAAARERGLEVEPAGDARTLPGAGVRAGPVVVGKRSLVEEDCGPLPPEAVAALDRLDAAGQTALFVARSGTLLGVIGVRDRVRPEAVAVVAALRAAGVRELAVVSGDRPAVVVAVAREVEVGRVFAGLMPDEKAEVVASDWGRQPPELSQNRGADAPRSPGALTVFVGDGINDAPALARAGVGVAVGSGTEIAAEAGDIVLMGEPLTPLPFVLRLSRQTVRIIRQNIRVFGFGVNIAGVVLTGWLWPLFAPPGAWLESAPLAAVLYHQIGSVAVLLNSMRLLAFERATDDRRWQQAREWLQAADRAVARFSLDELLHEAAHRWRAVAAVGGSLLLAAWLASGLTAVAPAEVGVVRRFGRPVEDVGPGLHYRYPWPVETVTRLRPAEVRTVEVGFRSVTRTAPAADGNWASRHAAGVARLDAEAVMATGDGNLVELLAAVRYTVADPRHYLFGVRDPDALVRSAAESVFRELVAGEAFLDLLTSRRADFQRAALARLERRLAETDPKSLGVRLDGLSLTDLHPPQDVVPAYHEVARAIQARDRTVNEALAEAAYKRREAEAKALELTRRAEADARDRLEQARAARDAFLARLKARSELTPSEEAALASLPEAERGPRRAELLEAKRFLTDFRLAWDALTEVLARRDKVIVDADGVPGRRTLLLFDPNLLRPPVVPERRTRPKAEEGP